MATRSSSACVALNNMRFMMFCSPARDRHGTTNRRAFCAVCGTSDLVWNFSHLDNQVSRAWRFIVRADESSSAGNHGCVSRAYALPSLLFNAASMRLLASLNGFGSLNMAVQTKAGAMYRDMHPVSEINRLFLHLDAEYSVICRINPAWKASQIATLVYAK